MGFTHTPASSWKSAGEGGWHKEIRGVIQSYKPKPMNTEKIPDH